MLALESFMNAANCYSLCYLLNSAILVVFERTLRPRLVPRACLPERHRSTHTPRPVRVFAWGGCRVELVVRGGGGISAIGRLKCMLSGRRGEGP
jgi:hypothetical protein